jgi:hypothetical protein
MDILTDGQYDVSANARDDDVYQNDTAVLLRSEVGLQIAWLIACTHSLF